MAKKKIYTDPYSEETIRKKRRFPTGKTVLLFVLLAAQIALLTAAFLFDPQPPDRIQSYELSVTPQDDGALYLSYRFVWTALDMGEDLTWVEIGMANPSFEFDEKAFSSNIRRYEKYADGDYVSARLYLDRAYAGGETLTFSFSVFQRDLLCLDGDGYFYEFIPGWFNATPVEHYQFTWNTSPTPLSYNANERKGGNLIWSGSMPCGTYADMQVRYDKNAFAGAPTVPYASFDGDVSDELAGDKIAAVILACVAAVFLLITQIFIIDSVVSYHRGRGFLTGYGHHIHVYGYTNPRYRTAQEKHSGGSSRGGGGCACACACACAGGGRAGCSQKDTSAFPIQKGQRRHLP